jgi:hypothetical protein
MGFCNSSLAKMSPTVPPETDRNVLPPNPAKKRVAMRVLIFGATADGIVNIMKASHATR